MATQSTITTTHDTSGLTLTFSNGVYLRLNFTELSDDIRDAAMAHGLKQKLVDAAAISRNPDTGRSATVDDKYNAVLDVYNRLLSGSWNKGKGEAGTAAGGLLFRALCRMYPAKTPDQLRAFLDKKTASEKAALRAIPKIAAIIEQLRAPTGPVDEARLFDGLED